MIDEKITHKQLESYLWEAANFLRNKIDAGDYKSYIFPLMFYKRISDVYDEEYEQALSESDSDKEYASSEVNHQFLIPDGCYWTDLRKNSKNIGQKILQCMREIEKANPDLLFGIFGDANWGNTERLSDETLVDLIEHFSSLTLSSTTVPDDLMGIGYEFLIKKFADDSGHTAAEFYTNRTVVSLMAKILAPKENEFVYDPTCGTGGMLLECINFLKRNERDYRTLKLFGQEKNIITSGIARMNMLLHGFEDAKIHRGDTLSEPLFLEGEELQKFDVVLANPPYSMNSWNKKKWNQDPYGRNLYGTPPQSRADFAFLQHIVASLSDKGRAAILFPHGVLFRDVESSLRKKLVEDDKLETVIGLGPDLFYNSPMESCILILKSTKDPKRKNKIQFINAINQVKRSSNKNYLSDENIDSISKLCKKFQNVEGLSHIADIEEIKGNQFLLSIPLYVSVENTSKILPLDSAISNWKNSSQELTDYFNSDLKEIEIETNN